jgi:hypothetical protein
LIVFQLAVYVPLIGRGLIFDAPKDFSAADYADWEHQEAVNAPNLRNPRNLRPKHFVAQNAAWWSAVGFALLFPANTWTVMYIATRAHLLSTLSYLAALIAALWYAQTARNRILSGTVVVICAGLSMFAKESGCTVIAAVPIVLVHQRQWSKENLFHRRDVILFVALLAVFGFYLALRSQSGAVSPASPNENYSYALSPVRLADNVLRYIWRTYGLLAIVAAALIASDRLRRSHHAPLRLVTARDAWLSLALFSIALAPFMLLSVRSATYSYLSGMGAALLLGAVARSVDAGNTIRGPRPPLLASSPILLVVVIYAGFTIGHSWKWVRMGEVDRAVLDQIVMQEPRIPPNTFVALKYSDVDRQHRFPDGFPANAFRYALRLRYDDASLDGKVVRAGEAYSIGGKAGEIQFEYRVVDGRPTIRKISAH